MWLFSELAYTMENPYLRTPLGPHEVSHLERCPYFRLFSTLLYVARTTGGVLMIGMLILAVLNREAPLYSIFSSPLAQREHWWLPCPSVTHHPSHEPKAGSSLGQTEPLRETHLYLYFNTLAVELSYLFLSSSVHLLWVRWLAWRQQALSCMKQKQW